MRRFTCDKKKNEEESSDSEDSTHVGMLVFSGGKVEESILTLDEAAKATPSIVQSWLTKGLLHTKMNEFHEDIQNLKRVIKVSI